MLRFLTICSTACAVVMVSNLSLAQDNSPPEGYISLFNGKNLKGWHVDEKGDINRWKVEDGAICYVGSEKGKSSHLFTDANYKNIHLIMDWKIEEKGTAGVYYGSQGILHIKIWNPNGKKPPASEGSGSLGYGKDRVRPLKKADKPLGEWNTFDITIHDELVTIKLNGELIIDKAPKRFKKPPYPIGLQDHGTRVCFKNIYLKPLESSSSELPGK